MSEGFCVIENTDVPVDDDRRCLTDGSVTIAPSYGKKGQQWVDGAWLPHIERPDGYVYRPRTFEAPSEKVVDTVPHAERSQRGGVVARTPMRDQGRACLECKRDDVPHYGHGLCKACRMRQQRAEKRRVAV